MAFLYAFAWYYKYSRDARGDFNISPHFKNFSGFARQKKTGEAVGLPLLVFFLRLLHKFKAYALNLKGKRKERIWSFPGTSQPGKRNGASFV